jgi:hypothetical protein
MLTPVEDHRQATRGGAEVGRDREYDEEILAGDLGRAGPNLFPHFAVIAVHGDKAWVRDVQNGTDHLPLVSRCRKIDGQAYAEAAEQPFRPVQR